MTSSLDLECSDCWLLLPRAEVEDAAVAELGTLVRVNSLQDGVLVFVLVLRPEVRIVVMLI